MNAPGTQFDRLGRLCDPVPGLLVYLGINVELRQKGLHVVFVLYGHEASFKILGDI